jgi:hypothetical protein
MARKTFEIATMVASINKALAESTTSADTRKGMIVVLENMLHQAGCYKGYRHLHAYEVPKGHLPAIRMGDDGSMLPYELRFLNCDDTRRHYY